MIHSNLLRIAVADDHTLVRNALSAEIAREADMVIVGECANGGDEVIPLELKPKPTCWFDLSMPLLNALQVMRYLTHHGQWPHRERSGTVPQHQ